MARHPGRPVHALSWRVVRQGRGRDPAAARIRHHQSRLPHGDAGRHRGEGAGRVTRATPFPGDPSITPALVREHNLTAAEYARIESFLGRPSTFAELGVFSALWSVHCFYKRSKPILGMSPTTFPPVLLAPVVNQGA